MHGKKKIVIVLSLIFIAIFAFCARVLWENTAPELNRYIVFSHRLPRSFDGYRIAQVSDFHNAEIGKNNEKLISVLKKAEPDIIVITGDIVDWRRTDMKIALDFVNKVLEIAPCYYVTGNNESYITEKYDVKASMKEAGVTVLEDEAKELEVSGERILLAGVDDPAFSKYYSSADSEAVMRGKLEKLIDGDGYTVLLSHRPELFSVYCDYAADLVLSGHAHGGQFRLPFIGGVYAPDQGFFPEYDAGLYSQGKTSMIVSRGIGNSIIPLRFNNRPEVIVIELKTEK